MVVFFSSKASASHSLTIKCLNSKPKETEFKKEKAKYLVSVKICYEGTIVKI